MFDDGITLHEKHSYRDFGAWLRSKNIPIPETIKIEEEVPYMQGVYDFSTIYDGEQTYTERELEYVFDLHARTNSPKKELRARTTLFVNWLKSSIKSKMIDDDYPGYYFLAEAVKDISVNDEDIYTFTVTVKLMTYALMIKCDYEGQTKWDEFCFLNDILQKTKYEVNNSKDIILYNNGIRSLTPRIICNSDFVLKKDDIEYKIKSGETKDYRFILKKGENKITIVGSGSIEFLFRIEVL